MNRVGLSLLRGISILGLACLAAGAGAELVSEPVHYVSGDTRMHGYAAWDDRFKGPRPGVLVVHEWWGLNEYARSRARDLAELGYVALAVDMYGDGQVADHPDEAGAFAQRLGGDLPEARRRMQAAIEALKRLPSTDTDRLAAIGYCFGGGVVLQAARDGLPLEAVVSFHGSLATPLPAQPGKVKSRVLVFNGAADPFVPDEQIAAFKQEMDAAGVDYRFVNYPGVLHSFTNPGADEVGQRFGLPLAYDAKADADSWAQMQGFLSAAFERTRQARPQGGEDTTP